TLKKIIEVGFESGKIKSYFSKGLNFIISQTNSIGHKNEKIMYNEVEYSNYHDCINKLSIDIQFTPIIKGDPELSVNEMTFQLGSSLDLMIKE
ncbi:HEPN domain-containing protein, partial [Enterococcus faecalis]